MSIKFNSFAVQKQKLTLRELLKDYTCLPFILLDLLINFTINSIILLVFQMRFREYQNGSSRILLTHYLLKSEY